MHKADFCPECNNTTILNDNEKGEIVCTTCGLVIGNTEYAPPPDRTPTKNTQNHPIAYTSLSIGTKTQPYQRTELNATYDIIQIIQKLNLPRNIEHPAINHLQKLRHATTKQQQNKQTHKNKTTKTRLTRTELAVTSVWTAIKSLNYPLTADEYIKKLQTFLKIQNLMKIEKRAAHFIKNENRIPNITLTTAHINKITNKLETNHHLDNIYANKLCNYAIQILHTNPGIITNRRPNLVAAATILAADKLLAKRLPLKTLANITNTGTANLSSLSETCKQHAPTVPPECAAIHFTENLFKGIF